MRLLNVKTRKLEEFFGDKIPPYAILSHRWTDDEVTFREVTQSRRFSISKTWRPKLEGLRLQAKRDNLAYIWIDTCCINKESSTELSEAINSMYRWYKNSSRCYAYLSDVASGDQLRGYREFKKSAWFTRGWTLQELIAPGDLRFYDASWGFIGTKTELSSILNGVTNIPRDVLLGRLQPNQSSVAQRMSWAARRVTTRNEDIAYCLLGIFDVTMPMIYGEGGEKAFLRLQAQIMLQSTDHSILAWGCGGDPAKNPGGLLATSPSQFFGSEGVLKKRGPQPSDHFEVAGNMLLMHIPITTASATNESVGILDCHLGDDESRLTGIPLEPMTSGGSTFFRPPGRAMWSLDPAYSPERKERRRIRVKIDRDDTEEQSLDLSGCVDIADIPENLALIEVAPKSRWAKERCMIVSADSPDAPTKQITLLRLRVRRAAKSMRWDYVVALVLRQSPPGPDGTVDAACEGHVMALHKQDDLAALADLFESLETKLCGRTEHTLDRLRLQVAVVRGKAPGQVGWAVQLKTSVGALWYDGVDARRVRDEENRRHELENERRLLIYQLCQDDDLKKKLREHRAQICEMRDQTKGQYTAALELFVKTDARRAALRKQLEEMEATLRAEESAVERLRSEGAVFEEDVLRNDERMAALEVAVTERGSRLAQIDNELPRPPGLFRAAGHVTGEENASESTATDQSPSSSHQERPGSSCGGPLIVSRPGSPARGRSPLSSGQLEKRPILTDTSRAVGLTNRDSATTGSLVGA